MRSSFFFILSSLTFLPLLAHAQGTDFVPLTSLPGLSQVATSDTLAPFLSNVYTICIGLAAVLAVLQLMRAGIMYMGGDSITEKKEARELITLSIVGLLLVLSPVIVFTIINPDILKLDIHTGNLQSGVGTNPGTTGTSPAAQTGSATGGVCDALTSFTFVDTSSVCSSQGTGWGDAPASCCSLGSGQKCCG